VAHNAGQVRGMGPGELVVGGVAGEGGRQGDPALVQDALDLEGVPADVVFAQQVDAESALRLPIPLPDHMAEDLVVGDVVPRGLGNALVPLAAEGEDVAVP